MCYTEYMYKDYLCHYGTKGMKWGVRRYQDYNGIYTPEGEARRLAKLRKGFYKVNSKKTTNTGTVKKKKKQNLTEEQRKARNKKIAMGAAAGIAAVGIGALAVKHGKSIARGRNQLVSMMNAMTRAEMEDQKLHKLLQSAKNTGDSQYADSIRKKIERNTAKYVTASDNYKELMKKKSNAKYIAKNAAKLQRMGKLSLR